VWRVEEKEVGKGEIFRVGEGSLYPYGTGSVEKSQRTGEGGDWSRHQRAGMRRRKKDLRNSSKERATCLEKVDRPNKN